MDHPFFRVVANSRITRTSCFVIVILIIKDPSNHGEGIFVIAFDETGKEIGGHRSVIGDNAAALGQAFQSTRGGTANEKHAAVAVGAAATTIPCRFEGTNAGYGSRRGGLTHGGLMKECLKKGIVIEITIAIS